MSIMKIYVFEKFCVCMLSLFLCVGCSSSLQRVNLKSGNEDKRRELDAFLERNPVPAQSIVMKNDAQQATILLEKIKKPETPRKLKFQLGQQIIKIYRDPEVLQEYSKFLVQSIVDGGLEEFMDPARNSYDPCAIGQYALIAADFSGFSSQDFEVMKDPRVIPILIQALNAPDNATPSGQRDKRNVERQLLPYALAKLDATEAVEPLKNIFRNHHDSYLRFNAVYALGYLMDRSESKALEEELRFTQTSWPDNFLFAFGHGLVDKGIDDGVEFLAFKYSQYYKNDTLLSLFNMIDERLKIIRNFNSSKLEQFYTQALTYAPLEGALLFDPEKIKVGDYSSWKNSTDALQKTEMRIVGIYRDMMEGIKRNKIYSLAPYIARIGKETKNDKIMVLSHDFIEFVSDNKEMEPSSN